MNAGARRVHVKRATRLRFEYPAELPISGQRDEIVRAIREHPVVVVCGETGSGKTTQLPKMCLEAVGGTSALVGHTQPRRIAARAVAERLAFELGVELGREVGFQVRFTDRTAPGTRVKVMTDGILLNEIRSDPWLDAYEALVIDEAHERTLNIDFVLGYLKRVTARRRGLKIVITSATIEPERFARHFDGAPIIRVAGRSYPVEIRYAPAEPGTDLCEAVVAACSTVAAIDLASVGGGKHRDVLVFLPGERWIHDAEQALDRHGPSGFEIVPLYARLAARRQERVFKPGSAPRIVLATNVAETSLTVPRIRFVVDSGLARVSRYAARHRVQALCIEPIAQANAIQRTGRCGRLAPGVCIRLYAEEDFAQRPAFADPEILRTNLAGVILRLEALALGHIDAFPFLDAPPAKAVNDAYRLLHVLGAIDDERKLTKDGGIMGRLPLDPRLARLLLSGHTRRCLREALVIAAALSTMDPREYPPEALEAARARHAKLADQRSDFTTYLNLWNAYRDARRQNERAFRTWCADNFLSPTRLTEWDDVHEQLTDLVASFGWRTARGRADDRNVHRAVLSAFVDLIAEKSERWVYRGMHDARAGLFPGSPVAARAPQWIVAAEHVATERPYFRTIAQINPRWVVDVAPHLVKRVYRDPYWDIGRGSVTVSEVASVFGLLVSADRRIDYGSIDAQAAREIFIRDALAADALGAELPFVLANRATKQGILDWEARLRSRDLFIGDRGIEAFYRARLPEQIRDRRGLVDWCRAPGRVALLTLAAGDLTTRAIEALDLHRYPHALEIAGQTFALDYRYEPGDACDGVTLRLPELFLHSVRSEELDWVVPGWLADKVIALARTLSKDLRRKLVPIPATVAEILPELERRRGRQSLVAAICEVLAERRGVMIAEQAFVAPELPPYLRFRVEVVGSDGRVVASGRDLRALQNEHLSSKGHVREAPSEPGTRRGLQRWDCGTLPERVAIERHGQVLELYPALTERDSQVDLELMPPGPVAIGRHRRGVRRLLLKCLPQQLALVRDRVLGDKRLLLAYHGRGTSAELVDDVIAAAADESFRLDPAIRDARSFESCLAAGRAAFVPAAERLIALTADLMSLAREIRRELDAPAAEATKAARRDIGAQVDELLKRRFLTTTPKSWLAHLPRYLKAARLRCGKLAHPKDGAYQELVERAWRRYADWHANLPADWPEPEAIERYRWMIEEFRVSLFAQALGTVAPVSAKRLEEAWREASSLKTSAT